MGEPAPHDADPTTQPDGLKKWIARARGEDGFADIWKRDVSAWITEDASLLPVLPDDDILAGLFAINLSRAQR